MNILVLGGNGFIGSHLVDRLIQERYVVSVFDKYPERYRQPLPQVSYFVGDFGNRGVLAEALQGIDIVFHLINTSLPKTSNDDPAYDVQSNVIETLYLLELCVAKKIKKIVYISSGGTIYGRPVTLPIPEDSPTNPECSYGIIKLTIEKYLALYHLLYGLDYVILRPSNPYGSRQNPDGIQGVISVFLGKVLKEAPVEIWGDGSVVRDYIYIDDLITGICRASFTESCNHIYNLGSGQGYTLNEIITTIGKVTKKNVNVIYKTGRAFDVPVVYLDITRAKECLKWMPSIPLEIGIDRTWRFINGCNV